MEHLKFPPNIIDPIVPDFVASTLSRSQQISWKDLTDTQKSQILLGSLRLFDHDFFLKEFKSWEEPETISYKEKSI